MKTRRNLASIGMALVTVVMAGCSQQPPTQDTPAVSSDQAALESAAPDLGPDVLAALAKADQIDGQEDQTIMQCYTCKLGMTGHSDYAVQVGSYQAHFCSDKCRESFEQDPHKVILATKIPGPSEG